jgi:hypothetical protein
MDYYNVSLHGFFSFFMIFFSKWSLSILLCIFLKKHCGLLQCFPTWFLFCYSISPHVFFQNYLCRIFLKYWAGWEFNFNFPHMFFSHLFPFFCFFFFQNCLLLLFFKIFLELFLLTFFFFIMELVENLVCSFFL